MNMIVGGIGASLALNALSGLTTSASNIYNLSSNIMNSRGNGSNEIKQLIRESDLERKIKSLQLLLIELNINEKSPITIQHAVQSIKEAIKNISDELSQIYYRMKYNDNLWVVSSLRCYKFHNSYRRLNGHLIKLESRSNSLFQYLQISDNLRKNDNIEDMLSQSTRLNAKEDNKKIDSNMIALIKQDLKKIECISSTKKITQENIINMDDVTILDD